MHVLRALTVLALASLLVLIGGAGPAQAHTELVGSSPADGDRLTEPPEMIELTFNEAVRPELATVALSVAGRASERLRVEQGETPSTLVALVPVDLRATGGGDLAWTLAYRVSSDDGHPVEGMVEFQAPASEVLSPTPTASAPTASTTSPSTTSASPEASPPGSPGSDTTESGTSASDRTSDRPSGTSNSPTATVVIGLIMALGVGGGCAALIRARRRDAG